MKAIFSITLLLGLVLFCYPIITGGYHKSSFNSNDARIDAAFKAVRSSVLQSANSQTVDVIPVAVYTQVVNGINYKIIAAQKDSAQKSVNLVTSVVYVGFSSPTTPMLKSVVTLPSNNLLGLLEKSQSSDINNEINNYLGQRGATLTNIVSIEAHPNLVLENDGYYIINADINTGGVASNVFLIMNEEIADGEKSFSVLQVRFAS